MILRRCLAVAAATGLTRSSRSDRLWASAVAVLDGVFIAMASSLQLNEFGPPPAPSATGAGRTLPQRCENSLYGPAQKNRKILGNPYTTAARRGCRPTQKGPDKSGPFARL